MGNRLYKVIARFGLMHMIATNLCEWLYVLVEETKQDIMHLQSLRSDRSTDLGKLNLISSPLSTLKTKICNSLTN